MTRDARSPSFQAKAGRLRLLLFDVDGVLTDGKVVLHPDGSESKHFHSRDGTAIVLAHRAGLLTGFLSARSSPSTLLRASQLSVRIVSQGVTSKIETYTQILREHDLTDGEVAFMGDDLLDLPVLARAGLSAAPADAVPEVRTRVAWVSQARGGEGAVRELVEAVLRAQNRWETVLDGYLGSVDA